MNTVSRYEAGGEMLSGTLEKIEAVLRDQGIVFIDEDEELGPGVRLRKPRNYGVNQVNRGRPGGPNAKRASASTTGRPTRAK